MADLQGHLPGQGEYAQGNSDQLGESSKARCCLDQPVRFERAKVFFYVLGRVFEACPVSLGSSTDNVRCKV